MSKWLKYFEDIILNSVSINDNINYYDIAWCALCLVFSEQMVQPGNFQKLGVVSGHVQKSLLEISPFAVDLSGTIEQTPRALHHTIELLCEQEVLWPGYCIIIAESCRGSPLVLYLEYYTTTIRW